MQDRLSKAYCESDAAWDLYCKTPTQTTWELYLQAKRVETELELRMTNSLCTCTEACDHPCKGECGCQVCWDSYQDFLSNE